MYNTKNNNEKHEKITKIIKYIIFSYNLIINIIWVLLMFFTNNQTIINKEITFPNTWISFIYIYHLIMICLILTLFPIICIFMKLFMEYRPFFEKFLAFCVFICLIFRLIGYGGIIHSYNNNLIEKNFENLILTYIIYGAIEIGIFGCGVGFCILNLCGSVCRDILVYFHSKNNENYDHYEGLNIEQKHFS